MTNIVRPSRSWSKRPNKARFHCCLMSSWNLPWIKLIPLDAAARRPAWRDPTTCRMHRLCTHQLCCRIATTSLATCCSRIRIAHAACETLTTQIFFTGDPWINSDVVGAVKPSLITTPIRHDDSVEMRNRGIERPFYTLSYDFE